MKTALATALVALLASLAPGVHAADHSGGQWTTAIVSKALSADWSMALFTQLRFDDDFDRHERTLLRPSLSWHMRDNQTLTAGYDAHFIETPRSRTEQRLWQQYMVRHHVGATPALFWFRLEQRFLPGVAGVAVRARLRYEATLPLAQTPWSIVVGDEVFLGLNELGGASRDGFEQNRVFVGLQRRLNDSAVAQAGYQNQYVARNGEDAMNHQLFVNLLFNLP